MAKDPTHSVAGGRSENQSLKVAEMFASIQGETSRAGLPCSFVRLAGCNLSCRYCDTLYARDDGEEIPIADILAWIEKAASHLVCVTGGEPLIQRGVKTLIAHLLRRGRDVLVETNGSIPVDWLPARAKKIVDIKTPGSGESKSFLIANLDALTRRDELKFVITGRSDFDWAARFIRRHRLVERCGVLISPAYGLMDPAQLGAWIIQSGLPLRLNLQLHKILWGPDARGV